MIFNNIQIQWTRFKYFHWINSGIMDEKTTATITKKQTGILKFEKNLKQKRNFSFHSIFDIKKIEIENNAILIKKRNWNKPEQFSFRFFQFSFNIWYIFPLTHKKNENVWCEWTAKKKTSFIRKWLNCVEDDKKEENVKFDDNFVGEQQKKW